MIIHARTPTRIDLAGGTLDIPPLYLFEDGGITLNMSITLHSEVVIEPREHGVVLVSRDTGASLQVESYDDIPLGGELDLVARVVRFYRPGAGLRVEAHNQAPKGSGLGASTALLMALSGALNFALDNRYSQEDLIRIGANIEAQCVRVPTGKQDYYGATYSGVKAIWFDVDGDRVEPLMVDERLIEQLESRLVLTFTGESHFSGATNWEIFRGYIEGVPGVRLALQMIKQTALEMRLALLQGDITEFARLLRVEWEHRKALAEGVSTPQIERMVHAAEGAGALASKICGAGGGGCMVTITGPENRGAIESALQGAGARLLSFKIDRKGLNVWSDD